jgi:DNA polymerase
MQQNKLLEQTRRYLIQQAGIYGGSFYIDPGILKSRPESMTLEAFDSEINQCRACRLAQTRNKFVFGQGSSNASVMCIGEAPGYEEDQKGQPFVGSAGQLLDKILAAIGFDRQEVFIANILKCRPPENRDPREDEINQCLPYLWKQVELIKPKLILVLGRIAAQALLGTQESLSNLRKNVHDFRGIPVFATYHPAALLRNPDWKRKTWHDVQVLREHYDKLVGDKPPMQAPGKHN